MKLAQLAVLAGFCITAPAVAGPPYLTDDPVPTDIGHWEIYAFTAVEGRRSDIDDESGFDLNYGPLRDVQLTATLPLDFTHDSSDGWRNGTGDVELGVKYRYVHDEVAGVSAAVFPRVILPTSSLDERGKVRLLLPLWVGKDFAGGTSLFGGGGYEFNPGPANRDFWQAGIAVTQDVSKAVSIGAEITRQGADTLGGTPQTRAGLGGIIHLSGPTSFLVSGGPTWAGHNTAYRFYLALGLVF